MYQNKGAIISRDGKYRYELWRLWDNTLPEVMFVMLNPSTADGDIDDPTIRKCVSYASRWGYGGIRVHNLFNYRAPHKINLLNKDIDPVGVTGFANSFLMLNAIKCDKIICAWGELGHLFIRGKSVARNLYIQCPEKLYCLRVNKSGHPSHPLYLPLNLQPMPYCEIRKILGV